MFIINSPSLYDVDAGNFIDATAIVDETIRSAINTLVLDLKGASLWTKMKALYPFVGGSATSHKYNLKNPLDTDAAYRLVFYGGWTHSSTGALPNGTNAYADTRLVPKDAFSDFNIALGVYSRTEANTYYNEMGVRPPTGASDQIVMLPRHSGNFYGDLTFSRRVSTANGSSLGLLSLSRISSTDVRTYRNATQLGINTGSHTRPILNQTIPLWLSALNLNGSMNGPSPREKALAYISVGLTSAEISSLTTIITTYQTSLSRNV
jgi:hypothetical protein